LKGDGETHGYGANGACYQVRSGLEPERKNLEDNVWQRPRNKRKVLLGKKRKKKKGGEWVLNQLPEVNNINHVKR